MLVDYGAGNLRSLRAALERLDVDVEVTTRPGDVDRAAIVVVRVSDVSAEAGLIANTPATASRTANIRVIRIQDSLPCGSEALSKCTKALSRSVSDLSDLVRRS